MCVVTTVNDSVYLRTIYTLNIFSYTYVDWLETMSIIPSSGVIVTTM